MIIVKNIYYMLAYAFQVLNESGYKEVETEEFENVAELCSAILIKGTSIQIKRGLEKDYIDRTEATSSIRGKLEISESLKTNSILKSQMVCSYDDFSVDTYLNRILKATLELLLRSDISRQRKKGIRRILVFFADISSIDINDIDWNIRFTRNNQNYRMLISVCNLVVKGLLQTSSDGSTKLMDFLDEQRMSRLYEKFILEYYRKEHPELKASASQIPWAVDDGYTYMLPVLQTDITLASRDKELIIDAKYYSHTTQVRFDNHTVHSSNMNQIFTYVKNRTSGKGEKEVSGMLLYARTDETIYPCGVYHISGNRISVGTLDLNCDFKEIRAQLDRIVADHFAKSERG